MRTQALRVTIGAYPDDMWHVSIIHDCYERGILVDSQMMWGPMYTRWPRIQGLVEEALVRIRELELDRTRLAAAG